MGIFEAVKKGFVLSQKLLNVVLVFFVFNAIIGLISLPLANPDKADDPGIAVISIITSVIFFLIFIFLQGGALGLVKDEIKTGLTNIGKFVEYGKKYYKSILALLLIYIVLAICVVLLLSLVSAGVLLLGDNGITRSILAAIITVVAIVAITMLIYPIYSVVVDDIGAVAALKKGIGVAKDHFWNTLGLFIVMLIISMVISLLIGFVIGLVTIPMPEGVGAILITLVNAAVQSYMPIIMMISFMSFYMALNVKGLSQQQSQY
ncbi:MAG: hypothetical protein PHH49_02375 [Candidatus Omnitrophica bacterium]|nr:hypothetical protein [Candidatus Omnitrophota bacterium]MDD5487793.1 hypothetical protein [Candidatus Omnitrophota bacterium]